MHMLHLTAELPRLSKDRTTGHNPQWIKKAKVHKESVFNSLFVQFVLVLLKLPICVFKQIPEP